jgi:hypothetical protein
MLNPPLRLSPFEVEPSDINVVRFNLCASPNNLCQELALVLKIE